MENNINLDNNEIFEIDSNEEQNIGRTIHAIPKPKLELGMDIDGNFLQSFTEAGASSHLDISKFESLSQVAQSRDQIYQLIDTMSEDTRIAAALEIYAEDATETNEDGRVMWVESDDEKISKYIQFLLDSINVDKNAYKWMYSLVKYGDLYLRLYRESDFNDGLFGKKEKENDSNKQRLDEGVENQEKETLNEDIYLKTYSSHDKYVHYLEMINNPSEMFELTKFGKSYAFIRSNVNGTQAKQDTTNLQYAYRYSFKKKDVNIYESTEFVHASIEDSVGRYPEEVEIFMSEEEQDMDSKLSYTVRRGQSVLQNIFKIWRELMLLENALLLNRITKSSLVRAVQVDVTDMPKEKVQSHLFGVKQLFEQKAAINSGSSMSEYTNPGPMENNIYIPTRDGHGAITIEQVGGDVDVKGLADIDFFNNILYAGLKIPKQYIGDTDDAGGFDGGTSLSLTSARYAKTIKRLQNTFAQAITDAINLMLIDKGLVSYINKFTLRMQEPTTREEQDRIENKSTEVSLAADIMGLVAEIEDPISKLRILKILLSGITSQPEILNILQEEIDRMEDELEGSNVSVGLDTDDEDDNNISLGGGRPSRPPREPNDFGGIDTELDTDISEIETGTSSEEAPTERLPSPAELGRDFTDNEMEI